MISSAPKFVEGKREAQEVFTEERLSFGALEAELDFPAQVGTAWLRELRVTGDGLGHGRAVPRTRCGDGAREHGEGAADGAGVWRDPGSAEGPKRPECDGSGRAGEWMEQRVWRVGLSKVQQVGLGDSRDARVQGGQWMEWRSWSVTADGKEGRADKITSSGGRKGS